MAKQIDSSEWVGLRQAAEILGVHPATVRNWADNGKLPFRRTAGKHRRFNLRDLRNLSYFQGDAEALELQVIMQTVLGQTRIQICSGQLEKASWYGALNEGVKQKLREQGREVLEAIRRFVAAGASDSALKAAIKLGTEYGKLLFADGLSLQQAMRGYYFFSDLVTNSILTWSELALPDGSAKWTTLLRHVNTFTRALQLSIVACYEAD